ncbi:MAG: SDR family oxidoreductase [Acidimicrobiales bacterium]|nr:SDR family oxidoreductase [Acidimicrobiales bacterium]
MTERVALITGAGRGIGAALAQRLAGDGWRLVLVDSCADDPALDYPLATRDDLDRTVTACGPQAAIGVVADVRSVDDLRAAVDLATDRFGGVDALVAAAGILRGGPPLWEVDEPAWQAQLDVNLGGVWNLARAGVPALLRRPAPRSGRFVAIASAAALHGHERLGAYSASKAAVLGLVRSLATDLGRSGVTANVVCPGSTRTSILDPSAAAYDLDDIEAFADHQLVGRLLEPAEVAEAIAWLCSPASSAVTGAVWPVDGGMTA